ncbi:hypothetical protein ACET3Z_010575 [Daucus carota]
MVLRNPSSKIDLTNIVTLVPRGLIKLPCYLQSPFIQHFGSSSVNTVDAIDTKKFAGICPLDDNIGSLPELEISAEYYHWMDDGLLRNNKKTAKYNSNFTLKFYTTDLKFHKKISLIIADISDSDDIVSKLSSKQDIVNIINGCSLPYSSPWSLVDALGSNLVD